MKSTEKFSIEVCLSPALYSFHHNPEAIVIVIDVLRATTAICSAFEHGAKEIIPVGSVEDARRMKESGYVLAAERDGVVLDFADFGNSPFYFTNENVGGKIVAYSTTNGTQAIQMASAAKEVVIGAFVNLSAVAGYLVSNPSPVVILCSGWKNRFNLEDTLCAGALAERLLNSGRFETKCDAVHASLDLWEKASPDIMNYIQKAAHRHRLKSMVLDDVLEYCHTIDLNNVIPILKGSSIVNINTKAEKAL